MDVLKYSKASSKPTVPRQNATRLQILLSRLMLGVGSAPCASGDPRMEIERLRKLRMTPPLFFAA
jgi:hypothetical protein